MARSAPLTLVILAVAVIVILEAGVGFVVTPPAAEPRNVASVATSTAKDLSSPPQTQKSWATSEQIAASATASAFMLAAEPALASDYDDRQGTAAGTLVGLIILSIALIAGIAYAFNTMYK
mmetsp:Transcript_7371/g.16105  ORF Transcript_7371/g.16105 Transcript_7371/m.16105 type:complete len:121 (+) Transcript_7371:53-415(+)|eukprot:CAMPEP_0170583836 /NCGR_PEP_ID=MMETSP0224-20130122/8358_1 /TAXON_ID=285029 /ORGANISM="Togula jolla, Strain CCCM 725" /LENGTH=120 /DNA_ID=CAMNT_0010907211 /DNA_START=51 /DNA_END=413 /DNA_ORIENTATION=+